MSKLGDLIPEAAKRDYKDEYKKFQSSTKSKKYRAELNKYNRKKGTYGNGDGKDASHKNGKIVGFESQSKNRGRAEKSRLKKEDINEANKMEKTMQKLAKSLGIKSVVSMHTGKGSLSYFLDDDREAKKLQKFLQRSFKRVRLIPLDKSKGDTANWVVAADMLGFESVNESEQDKIKQFLMKKGDNEKDATEKLKYYDMVSKMYKGANSTKKAEIMTSLWANEAVNNPSFFDGESINERFRPSDRKTLMVVVRDTIDKLRKRNPDIDEPSKKLGQALNSILRAMTREKSDANYRQYKKYFPKYNDKLLRRLATAYFDEPYNVQNTFIRDAMKYSLKDVIPNLKLMSFYKYMADFYGKKGIYPDKKGRDLKVGDIDKALVAYKKKWGASEFEGDTLDRERVRDILIKMRKLDPDYSKKESVNEGVSKSQAKEIMRQLGGRKFEMLMGVKSKGIGKDGLILHIGKNPKRVSHIIIDLDRGRDLYNLTFGKIVKYQFKVIKKLKGIYVDQLHDMIEKYTGNLTTFRPRR